MKRPLFSICIPNYNYGLYIGETIKSVLNQTYPHFEIIVSDNASTDTSAEVVRSFKDERIRLIRNRYNIGFAPNLQKVTSFAKNDYLNLLSSDDQMKPTALEDYARAIEEMADRARNGIVLMSDSEGFDDEGRITRFMVKSRDSFRWVSLPPETKIPDSFAYTTYSGYEVLREGLTRLGAVGMFCSMVYSRSLWEAVEGYNSVRTIGPDKHFSYKILSKNPMVCYVHKILFRYRDHVSDNRAAMARTIRDPMDDYLNVLEFGDDSFLGPLGLKREALVRAFLDSVLRESLVQMGLGRPGFSRRLFHFCLSTFPKETFRMPRAYMLLPFLALGPLGRFTGPPLRGIYRRFMKKPQPLKI